MGARGPAPTPTVILKLRGSRRANERRDEPRLSTAVPGCPGWLPPEAKAEWRRVTDELVSVGMLTKVDRAMLAVYCETWAQFVDLVLAVKEEIAAGGLKRAVKLGLLSAKQKAAEKVAQFAQQFGLTPSARTRIRMVDQVTANEDEDGQDKGRFFRGA